LDNNTSERIAINEIKISNLEKSVAGIFNRTSDINNKINDSTILVIESVAKITTKINEFEKKIDKFEKYFEKINKASTMSKICLGLIITILSTALTVSGVTIINKYNKPIISNNKKCEVKNG
jgi:hypothetical protein